MLSPSRRTPLKKITGALAAAAATVGVAATPAQAHIGPCWTYSGHSSGYTLVTRPVHLCKATLPLTLTTTRGGDMVTPAGRSTLFFLKLRARQRVHIAMRLLASATQTVGVESTLELAPSTLDPWLTVATRHGLVRVHAIGWFTNSTSLGFKMITRGGPVCVYGADPFLSPRIYPWPDDPGCALTHATGYGYSPGAGYYQLYVANNAAPTLKGHPTPPTNLTVRITLR